jgi:regulator of protease activity HflC (stomatin/prohibitin superfamily)
MIGIVILGIIIVAIVLSLYLSWFTVEEKQAVVIQRWKKFNRVIGPGLRFMLPFGIEKKRKFKDGDKSVDYIDQRERSVDLPAQNVITKDNVQLQVDSIAYYRIADAQKAVYNVTDVIMSVNQLIKTSLRDVIGDTTLQELLSGRDEINRKLRDAVANASADWGVEIRSVELQAVSPPESYVDAMRKVSEAELTKKAFITEAEGKKQAHILEAEGEAEKISRIYKAIHDGKPNEELLKIRYLEALEKIANGQATKIFMPFPSNPTSGNFFQQAFGMAAGLDAYQSQSQTGSGPTESEGTTQIPQSDEKITIQCPNPTCQYKATIRREKLGKTIKCPKCSQPFVAEELK